MPAKKYFYVVGGDLDGQTIALTDLQAHYGKARETILKATKGNTFSHARVTCVRRRGRKPVRYLVIGGERDGEKMTAREIMQWLGKGDTWVYWRVHDGEFYWEDPDAPAVIKRPGEWFNHAAALFARLPVHA